GGGSPPKGPRRVPRGMATIRDKMGHWLDEPLTATLSQGQVPGLIAIRACSPGSGSPGQGSACTCRTGWSATEIDPRPGKSYDLGHPPRMFSHRLASRRRVPRPSMEVVHASRAGPLGAGPAREDGFVGTVARPPRQSTETLGLGRPAIQRRGRGHALRVYVVAVLGGAVSASAWLVPGTGFGAVLG